MSTATSDLHIRIDAGLKAEAEGIFQELGVTPASAVSMFYSQVVMNDGLPFKVVRRYRDMPNLDEMSDEELRASLNEGAADYEAGRVKSVDEVFAKMNGVRSAKL